VTAAVSGPVAALDGLRDALDAVAAALVAARSDDLLAVEGRLAAAVTSLPSTLPASLLPDDRRLLREHVAQAQAALIRCRRLGASLGQLVETTLVAHGFAGGYDRGGLEATVTARVGALDTRG
jgi:hypothetical protein